MILNDSDFSTICYIRHLKAKCTADEKVGLIRGIPSVVKKTWIDRLKEKIYDL